MYSSSYINFNLPQYNTQKERLIMLKWFLTGADKPRIQDQSKIHQMYHNARLQSVTAMILGYGMYLCYAYDSRRC